MTSNSFDNTLLKGGECNDKCFARKKEKSKIFQKEKYEIKRSDGHLEILKNNNDRIIKVDASKDIDEISDFILKVVMEKINEAI